MKTIKLSYSILNAWSSGSQENAIGMYLGKSIPDTPALELGRLKHKEWEIYTRSTNRIAEELGGDELTEPILETKYQRYLDFNDNYQLLIRGVLDVETDNIGIDYKCGKTSPSAYLDSKQAEVYKVLRPNIEQFIYICYNPYTKEVKRGLKYLTDKSLEDGLNYIYTYAGEIINYLESQKLIIDYKETTK